MDIYFFDFIKSRNMRLKEVLIRIEIYFNLVNLLNLTIIETTWAIIVIQLTN